MLILGSVSRRGVEREVCTHLLFSFYFEIIIALQEIAELVQRASLCLSPAAPLPLVTSYRSRVRHQSQDHDVISARTTASAQHGGGTVDPNSGGTGPPLNSFLCVCSGMRSYHMCRVVIHTFKNKFCYLDLFLDLQNY